MKKNEKIQLQLESINSLNDDPNTCRVTMRTFDTNDVVPSFLGQKAYNRIAP